LEILPAYPVSFVFSTVRALPGGGHAMFYGYGEGLDSTVPAAVRLYRIDLTTKNVVRLAPNLELSGSTEYTAPIALPLAVSRDGKEALLDLPSGDLHRLIAIPLDGGSSVRTLLTLTAAPYSIDAGADGSIYVDQPDDRLEVMRTAVTGASVERLARSTIPPQYCSTVLSLPDGRLLFPTRVSGRARLLVTIPGKEPRPFADTAEESAPPIALAGADQVAFLLGRPSAQVIALASATDGRLTRRIDVPSGTQISCLASSPDGKMIYYISKRNLSMISSLGGEPHKLVAADSVALNPKTGEIVLQRNETGVVHFFRFDPVQNREQRIAIRSADAPASGGPLNSGAVAPDGRIVLPVAPLETWAWGIGILDPLSSSIKRVPMSSPVGGLNSPAWTSDGRIVFAGVSWLQSSLWRFQPLSEKQN
jgi:hypothetical protein